MKKNEVKDGCKQKLNGPISWVRFQSGFKTGLKLRFYIGFSALKFILEKIKANVVHELAIKTSTLLVSNKVI